jgi:hypothetical protein
MTKSILYKFLLGGCFLLVTSCEEILFEKDISKSEVVLVAPVNNAKFFSTGVTFTWETVQETTKYKLQIAKPNFTDPLQIVLDTIIINTSFTHQLAIGEYEWRVQASNESYSTNYSSSFFTVVSNADFQSNIVVLNTPASNSITKTALQNLSWQPIMGASAYQIKVMDGNSNIINDQSVTGTSLNFTFPEGTYQWRVRATNGTQETLDSSRSILVDTTAPNTPTLTSPADKSTTTNKDVSLQWNRTPILGSTEKDSIYIYTNSTLTTLQLKKEASSPSATTLDLGIYYWFVKSFDQAGNVSDKSSVFNFTIN